MARQLFRAGWLVVLLVVAAACEPGGRGDELGLRNPQPTPTGTDTRIVGLVGTMSGPEAWRGEDAYEGADLGVHVLSRAGGPPYELVTLDDRGSPQRAGRLIERLAALRHIAGIVYAGPGGALDEAEPPLAAAGIPLLASYGAVPDRRHIFAMAPAYATQARRLVGYATSDRGYQTLGLLTATGIDGRRVRAAVRSALAPSTHLVVGTVGSKNSLQEALRALRAGKVEGLIVAASPPGYTSVLRALAAGGESYRTTAAARIASAPSSARPRGAAARRWCPQVLAFELAVDRRVAGESPGVVAAASYDRGAFYLPLPAFRSWRKAFTDWWQKRPYGWQLRAYRAVRLIGVAAAGGTDGARALEEAGQLRLTGAAVGLTRHDHEVAGAAGVGLWVVPRPGLRPPDERRLPPGWPWVPLARGFAAGARSRLPPAERSALFPPSTARAARPPRFTDQRWGVTTGRSDPVH